MVASCSAQGAAVVRSFRRPSRWRATIGVFQGAMLFGLAAVWPSLGSGWAVKIAQYCALVGFYANRKFKAAVTAKRSGALLQFFAIAGVRLDGSERSYFGKPPRNFGCPSRRL
jgi:hypothetical protein